MVLPEFLGTDGLPVEERLDLVLKDLIGSAMWM
jgi:hypothetical protein